MVLHYLSVRSEQSVPGASTAVVPENPGRTARAGFVVGRAVGNSVVRHRVTRRLRELVRAELHRLPPTADLVVRARPDAGLADSAVLRRDLTAGLDRLLPQAGGHA